MNTYTKTSALLISLFFLFSSSSYAADSNVRVTNLVDAGTDGDERFYTVYCSSGKQAALVKRYEIGEVCTKPSYSEKDICKNWTVDEAAIEACK